MVCLKKNINPTGPNDTDALNLSPILRYRVLEPRASMNKS
jgi:hypothetical protein